MGLLTPIVGFATEVSIGTWIQLLIAIGVVALMYLATGRIITQAGYSALWILLPIAPLVFTTICFFIFWHDLNTIIFGGSIGFIGISTVGLFWHLDQISFLANFAFFIVFAFIRWPVSGGQHSPDTDGPRQQGFIGRGPSAPSSGPMTPSDPVNVVRSMPASPGGPGPRPIPGDGPAVVASAPPAKRPVGKSCAWCGEALPGNRALFHDCGPKDRPEVFCKKCGNALSAGTSQCSSCGAA